MFVDLGERLKDLMHLPGFTVTKQGKAHKRPIHREETFILQVP